MKYFNLAVIIVVALFFSNCKSAFQPENRSVSWCSIGAVEGVEVFIDTTSIKHEGAISYASEKRVYTTPHAKKTYIDKIRNEYTKMGKPEKANKWSDFSYSVYHCLYECANRRFRVLSVEDYDSTGKLIIKTTPARKNIQWLDVATDTVGDYTFFFVCDYE